MLLFAAPFWLALPPALLAAGLWATFRARRKPRPVSSLRLWQNLQQPGSKNRPRTLDPVWLLILLAALLSALALARPQWRTRETAKPPLPIECTIRSIRNADAQAWLRIPNASAPAHITLANSPEKTVAREDLRTGILLPITGDTATLTITSESTNFAPITRTFSRPTFSHPFALLSFGPPDAVLERAFSVMPGARPGDPTVRPAVILATAPGNWRDAATRGLVIAAPDVPLPGLIPGEQLHLADLPVTRSPTADLPSFIHFDQITVNTMRAATLSTEWKILATVQGRPWLALRPRAGDADPVYLWMASRPAEQSSWFASPSMVMLLAAITEQALGTDQESRMITWTASQSADPLATVPTPVQSLTPPCGFLAITLLLSAAALLQRRLR